MKKIIVESIKPTGCIEVVNRFEQKMITAFILLQFNRFRRKKLPISFCKEKKMKIE